MDVYRSWMITRSEPEACPKGPRARLQKDVGQRVRSRLCMLLRFAACPLPCTSLRPLPALAVRGPITVKTRKKWQSHLDSYGLRSSLFGTPLRNTRFFLYRHPRQSSSFVYPPWPLITQFRLPNAPIGSGSYGRRSKPNSLLPGRP